MRIVGIPSEARAGAVGEYEALLARSEIFRLLPEDVRSDLARGATEVLLGRREVLDLSASPGVYVVAAGRVRVMRGELDDATRAVTLGYLCVGESIGEVGLVEPAHGTTLRAAEDCRLLRVPLVAVQGLLSTRASFATELFRACAARQLDAERRLYAQLTRPVEARICAFVEWAAARHGVVDARGTLITVKFTHLEIAEYVGATRETVTLSLGALRRAEVLAFDRRRLVVLDAEALTERANRFE